jgi:Na+-driven multidrug efflux pump
LTKKVKRTEALLKRGIMPAVLTLTLPVVAQSLLQVLIGTVDLKMVGVLGRDAIAAVAMGRQVFMVIMILVLLLHCGQSAIPERPGPG